MQTLSFEEWYDSRSLDEYRTNVRDFLDIYEKLPACSRNGPWIVGGTIRRLLGNEKLTTDVDIMFKNQHQYDDYCGWLSENGAKLVDESPRQSTFEYEGWKIQPICAEFSNTLNQTLNKFDFTICQFGHDGTNLMWGDDSMEHLTNKKLVFTRTNDHISTMRRAFKYAHQGFFMDQDSISKFMKSAIRDSLKVEADMRKWEAEAAEKYASGGFRPSLGSGLGVSSFSV